MKKLKGQRSAPLSRVSFPCWLASASQPALLLLRRALLALEVSKVQQYPFTERQQVAPADWEAYVGEVAADMLREQSPKSIFVVRGALFIGVCGFLSLGWDSALRGGQRSSQCSV